MIRANEALRASRRPILGDGASRAELWRRFLGTRRRTDRNELAEHYLPLVRTVAEVVAGRVPRSVDPEDLFSVGVFGLLQSIESFDPARGAKFETWSKMRIRGAMIDELRSHDRLSREARGRARTVASARGRLRQELCREPTHHELAQRLSATTGQVESILARALTQRVVSLDLANEDPGESEESLLLADDLVDACLEPAEAALRNELLACIESLLSAAERDLVRLRYGDGLTMRKIGRKMGLSESRVSQLHSRLLLKLHRRFAVER